MKKYNILLLIRSKGKSNPKVSLLVLKVPKEDEVEESSVPSLSLDLIDKSDGIFQIDDFYIARVGWWPDGVIMAQVY